MSAVKRKVNPLTIQEKKAVILEVENSNGRTKSQIAEQFHIPKSTLSTILKEKERILNLNDIEQLGPQRKRMRARRGTHPQLEEALFAWLQQQDAGSQTVTAQRVLAYSQELARQLGVSDFKCSAGWLDSFRRRHGLAGGRAGPADGWRADLTAAGALSLSQLPAMLDDYAAADVFVVASMGLVFDLTPAQAHARVDSCAGGELAPRRLSVLAAASADGSQKLPLLVAGQPVLGGASQPGRLAYRSESRGWLRPADFAGWLERRNGELAAQGRRALFLCEAHPLHAAAGAGAGLESVELACLPASPLTRAQLAADGVLHQLKRQFRRRVAGWLADHQRPPNADEAVTLLSRAWWSDVSAEHVVRFHAAAGLLRRDAANGVTPPVDEAAAFGALAGGAFQPPPAATFADFVTADDAVWWSADPPSPQSPPPAAAAAAPKPDRQASPAVKADRRAPSPALSADRQGSPPVKRERSPPARRECHGSPAARRRPSSQEALKAVLVLQHYFQLRELDEELDEVLSFVAFTREKIVKLQSQETNGSMKLKKEAKSERPDMLGTIKFESPILSIDPDVDPQEEMRDQLDVQLPPPRPTTELMAPRKGGIRVGPQFQADVPGAPLGSPPDVITGTGTLEETRWSTEHKLTDDQMNQFVTLARAVGMFARACDATSAGSQQGIHVAAANASRDVTRAHALDLLYRHNYSLSSALASLVPSGGPVLCRDELEDWSVNETLIFEDAVARLGKHFHVIRRECLPWKTTSQISEYYYMWKTTDRYVRRRRAKHMARRQAAAAATAATASAALTPTTAASTPAAASASAAASPGGGGAVARPASDALTLLSPMLNALGTSVSIEPVAAGSRRSPDQRGRASVEKLCAGVRLSGECSITPVPLSR